jgi:hypothetical protein
MREAIAAGRFDAWRAAFHRDRGAGAPSGSPPEGARMLE